MKKIFYILFLCFFQLNVFAQSEYDEFGMPMEDSDRSPFADNDSARANLPKIPHQRLTWKWAHNGVYKEYFSLDTTYDRVHRFDPIFKKSISNSYLANLPSPYLSNIFIERPDAEDFYVLTQLRAFFFKPEDALEFNTTTPYTQLNYFTGGRKRKAENYLDIWHVQNIRPFWSAGFRYNLLSSDGRYMNQKSKAYNLAAFSSYEKRRLAYSFFINQNNAHVNENGGIIDKFWIADTTAKSEDIGVKLPEGYLNTVRNFNFYSGVQFSIGKPRNSIKAVRDSISAVPLAAVDSTLTDSTYVEPILQVYPFKIAASIHIEDNVRRFRETTVSPDFFPETYISTTNYADYTRNKVYKASAKLVVNEHPKLAYLPGVYVGADWEYLVYRQRITADSIYGNTTYTGYWLNGGFFNVDSSAMFQFDANARICLAGDYIGNFSLEGFIRQYFNKNRNSHVRVDAAIKSQNPNHYLIDYFGNHDIWRNNFDEVKTFNIKGRYINERLRSEIGAGWNNMIDYVYLDTNAEPRQTSKAVMVLSAWAKQHFRLGHFHFDQTVYVQKSTQEEVVDLPLVSLYSHNYYKNNFFKNALGFIFGVDLHYNTKFYASKYNPATMLFYNQSVEKTGNYPKVDVFINLNIKRANIFIKYEHLNQLLFKGNYFTAVDYPLNPAMLKYGVSWNFFD